MLQLQHGALPMNHTCVMGNLAFSVYKYAILELCQSVVLPEISDTFNKIRVSLHTKLMGMLKSNDQYIKHNNCQD